MNSKFFLSYMCLRNKLGTSGWYNSHQHVVIKLVSATTITTAPSIVTIELIKLLLIIFIYLFSFLFIIGIKVKACPNNAAEQTIKYLILSFQPIINDINIAVMIMIVILLLFLYKVSSLSSNGLFLDATGEYINTNIVDINALIEINELNIILLSLDLITPIITNIGIA